MSKSGFQANEETTRKESIIYCGPNLSNGILQQFAIFKGELPKHIKDHIKKYPAIEGLFVAPSALSQVRNNIKTEGTKEYILFNQILHYERSVK